MHIILGIDPGSRCTGYGVIWSQNGNNGYVTHGEIRTRDAETAERLRIIQLKLNEVIAEHNPHTAAIEQVFVHQNAGTALKLGQARGVALATAATAGLAVNEYSAKQIKQAVVGYGAASKAQVQRMITTLLKLSDVPGEDAADALAVALCHSHSKHVERKLERGTVTAGATA